ncbi:MAG: hypothetical protein KDD51_04755 [Bdellovibrionales bacterium]|nr:hypothetical protein [Bdellovibrionales bacterium]
MKFWLSVITCLMSAMTAEAAYRVFQLKITYYDSHGVRTGQMREVLSTLDPLQYEHYYAGFRRMEVRLKDSWYCPGDTRRREFCNRPKVRERAPSSLRNSPNRVELPYQWQPIIPR